MVFYVYCLLVIISYFLILVIVIFISIIPRTMLDLSIVLYNIIMKQHFLSKT